MKLQTLHISKDQWGPKKGIYSGHIEFEDDNGEIKINLTEKTIRPIMEAAAESLMLAAQEGANAINRSVLEASGKLIENGNKT